MSWQQLHFFDDFGSEILCHVRPFFVIVLGANMALLGFMTVSAMQAK